MFGFIHRGIVALLLIFAAAAMLVLALPASRVLTRGTSISFGEKDSHAISIQNNCISITSIRAFDSETFRTKTMQRISGRFSFFYSEQSANTPTPGTFSVASVLTLSLPLWIVVAVCAPYPLLVFAVAWRKRRRRIPHGCRQCNYDLTGNQSGKCPECGDIVRHHGELPPATRSPSPRSDLQ